MLDAFFENLNWTYEGVTELGHTHAKFLTCTLKKVEWGQTFKVEHHSSSISINNKTGARNAMPYKTLQKV